MADHPEFETEHTPRGLMVWVPVPYFDSLCRKAYGTPATPVEVDPNPEVPPAPEEVRPLEYVPPRVGMEAMGYVPQGYAATKIAEAIPPEAPSDDD